MTIWTELAGVAYSIGFVDAAGVPTRALRAGQGEDVVMLHGTSGHLEAFIRNVPAFAAHYRVHAIDLLGHGWTGKPDYPYEIPRYVEHVLAYLDACGIGAAHLIGESLGGPARVGGQPAGLERGQELPVEVGSDARRCGQDDLAPARVVAGPVAATLQPGLDHELLVVAVRVAPVRPWQR